MLDLPCYKGCDDDSGGNTPDLPDRHTISLIGLGVQGKGRYRAGQLQGKAGQVRAKPCRAEMGKSRASKESQINKPGKSCLEVVSIHGPLSLQASIMSSLQDAVSDVLLARNTPVQMLMPQKFHEGPLHTRVSAHMHIRVYIQHSYKNSVAFHFEELECTSRNSSKKRSMTTYVLFLHSVASS